jgi:acetate---CoA ligase (ADP-forming)
MEKFFYPESLVIIGLSSKSTNIARLILENLLRWGYKGRIFGVNPGGSDEQVQGICMYCSIEDLPEVPDLAVCMVPARFIPEQIEACGRFGVRHAVVPSGGFSELSDEGARLAEALLAAAGKYGLRFMGPNGLMVANTDNGLCIPFLPLFRPPKGRMSIISQSGGLGLMLWNLMKNENIGMAKFASIGNKLDVDEVDVLEYFLKDPETGIICMYLESMAAGSRLIKAAAKAAKPIVVYKSNTTTAGKRAAASHTAALSNDEDVIDAALEEAGIIRIHDFSDFIAVAKAFELPPMRGNRVMVMSPYGGFAVIGADLCEKSGLEFADPGEEFYDGLKKFVNAGVIRFGNPLDMGDIYDALMSAHVGFKVLHNDKVDGAIYIGQRDTSPDGDNPFSRWASTDVSKETYGAILSSGKPLAICLYGYSSRLDETKHKTNYPIFNSPEESVRALVIQKNWHARMAAKMSVQSRDMLFDRAVLRTWLDGREGMIGEESLELIAMAGIPTLASAVAADAEEAIKMAGDIGYPVVMKVVSPDAFHKTEAGGVVVGVADEGSVRDSFSLIRENLERYKKGARFTGIRVQKMSADGYDMFIGGKCDQSFGPVIVFGFGGIYVEAFKDVATCLCPASPAVVRKKMASLKSYAILKGIRGNQPLDIDLFVDAIIRISHILAEFPEIKELDVNPLRLFKHISGGCALDTRMVVRKG